MDDGFIAKPLGRRQIDQAYPLVCAIAPGLGVDQWRAFAAALLDSATGSGSGKGTVEGAGRPADRGIMTVQNAQGYMHGLFSYAAEPHLLHGRTLCVDNFVVLDLFDVAGVAEALLRAMEGLARQLGCAAIHTTLPDRTVQRDSRRDPIPDCFRTEGHRQETIRFCKDLAVVNDNAPAVADGRRGAE
ncbi:phage tail protein X [Azospirillum lipoferum]|uniref:N-acetyltransferase domain-containing protein n=1 Tax=Azospirillum lipoferum TaxID=193 RepID=A0A5A9GEJ4_AZOLI|nr:MULTISPECIES: hypothetical protein [Azospirillum]KAA0592225.1 hypothetical protein FZ942_28805 [Azospirillum lipoferum]MCP1612292.1 phage tail protein X [Azospirillum lipoferum]MDW5536486.1 hypothetical protein [Azospirillum sp. NL1]